VPELLHAIHLQHREILWRAPCTEWLMTLWNEQKARTDCFNANCKDPTETRQSLCTCHISGIPGAESHSLAASNVFIDTCRACCKSFILFAKRLPLRSRHSNLPQNTELYLRASKNKRRKNRPEA
jgi:hypothetical protein